MFIENGQPCPKRMEIGLLTQVGCVDNFFFGAYKIFHLSIHLSAASAETHSSDQALLVR